MQKPAKPGMFKSCPVPSSLPILHVSFELCMKRVLTVQLFTFQSLGDIQGKPQQHIGSLRTLYYKDWGQGESASLA